MRLDEESGILDFNEKIRYRIEKLKKIFSDEAVLVQLAQAMVPHVICQDEHGHSMQISFRIHPAQGMELMSLWDKHAITFPHKSDYYRYLLTLGFIIDRIYWESEDIGEIVRNVVELQRRYAAIALKQQINTLKEKEKFISKISKTASNIEEEILRKLEEI